MSDKLPVVSGARMVKFLESHGFRKLPRKGGSHIIMTREGSEGGDEFSVPDHKELKRGTMMSVLRSAGVSREEFVRHFRRH